MPMPTPLPHCLPPAAARAPGRAARSNPFRAAPPGIAARWKPRDRVSAAGS